MYKGNMEDFVSRVSQYTDKEYGFKIGLTIAIIPEYTEEGYKTIRKLSLSSRKSWVIQTVEDSEDFEQKVYEFVNNIIEKIKS